MTQRWNRFDLANGGGYLGFAVCEESALIDRENWTSTPLPYDAPAGMCWMMTVDGAWSLTHDYRGQIWHDPATGQQIQITRAGDAPADGWVQGFAPVSAPTQSELLAAAQAKAVVSVETARETRIAAGIDWTAPDGTAERIQTRAIDLRNLMTLQAAALRAALAGSSDPSILLRTESNTDYTLTPQQMLAVAAAVQQAGEQAYQWSWALKGQIAVATTVEEVQTLIANL